MRRRLRSSLDSGVLKYSDELLMKFKKSAKLIAVAAVVLIAYHLASPLGYGMRVTLALLIMASALWVTEAVPLGITAFIIAFAQPLMGIQPFEAALEPFFAPTVVLLLGGFFLAIAFEKQDLDEVLAYQLVARFGNSAKILVLGLMFTTAFLSMWISNTASTALMTTLALNLTIEEKSDKDKENFAKIVVLGTAYSATAGGLTTLIGTPPNALAAGMLQEMVGYNLTFLGWSLYGLPITAVLIVLIWVLLFKLFPTEAIRVQKPKKKFAGLNRKQKLTLTLFVLAVVLWVTGSLPEPVVALIGWKGHGIPASVVALLVATTLFMTGPLNQNDISRVDWNTLLLFGGGLSLGSALEVSGLTGLIGQSLASTVGVGSSVALYLVLGFSTLIFTIIASNTASANIFIPIAISGSVVAGISPVVLAVFVAIISSLDFMLPVGTPPNAIAYSTGKVKIREMIKAGLLLDILGALITMLFALTFWILIS